MYVDDAYQVKFITESGHSAMADCRPSGLGKRILEQMGYPVDNFERRIGILMGGRL